jgi:hypothetical protein
VEFFDLWLEQNEELKRWYDAQCASARPMFELHGHGYGPLWWLVNGNVLDCLTKPYEYSLTELQQRSSMIFDFAAL